MGIKKRQSDIQRPSEDTAIFPLMKSIGEFISNLSSVHANNSDSFDNETVKSFITEANTSRITLSSNTQLSRYLGMVNDLNGPNKATFMLGNNGFFVQLLAAGIASNSSEIKQQADWSAVFYSKNGKTTVVDQPAIAYKPFPLFYDTYLTKEAKCGLLVKLFDVVELGEYKAKFEKAMATKLIIGTSGKLISNKAQAELMGIFVDQLCDDRNGISNQHYEDICRVYNLKGRSYQEQAATLICVAANMLNLSSERMFGAGHDSIGGLRVYAQGLLLKAHAIDKSIFIAENGVDQFERWMPLLKGDDPNNVLTCLTFLRDVIEQHLEKKDFANLKNTIKPTAW